MTTKLKQLGLTSTNEEPTVIIANISGIDSYSWLERTFSIEKISGTVLMR